MGEPEALDSDEDIYRMAWYYESCSEDAVNSEHRSAQVVKVLL